MSSPSRRRVPLDTPERLAEVLTAALDVVAEVGYERFNMDLVAQKAHVSKGSLYQRWPSKAHLIVAALNANRVEVVAPDTGSYLGDVRELCKRWLRAEVPGDRRGLLLALLEGSRRDLELSRLMTEQMGQGGTNPMAEVLAAADARGELPPGLDLELMAELPLAVAISGLLFRDAPLTEQLIDRIVDGLLAPLLGQRDHSR
ncbi:TetR/AcrR family transcriptional regulator [Kutzneria sp. CA-103260]|uniref:TetR/AcrR family transcriptional regulator n=1 Tax=Kutzneria sp. CA-103260 TaxID=2802641 RepID=UPI001BAD1571|nr:TetR/AcrR family transcriptional regulator [Kutzneria sp. CA-103260]QUQ68464.1 TetR family transcriptional regulator [Kutzneria sp. CA-103260]